MFGKKSSTSEDIPVGESAPEAEQTPLRIATIPDDFYGGKNPAIYEPSSKKAAPAPVPEVVPPVEEDVDTVEEPASKKKLLIVVGIISFILFVVGVTLYYLYDAGVIFAPTPEPPAAVAPPVVIEQPEPEPEPEPIPEPEPEPEPIIVPTSSLDIPIEFPAFNTSQSPDIDDDELTDAEELVIGTDPGIWDSDEDGYYDGQEVKNLYNPTGFAPVRIIDSANIVREYTNPTYGYKVYYPQVWNVGSVDTSAREVLFSSITGDYIALYTRPMESGENFQDWFVRSAKDQRITDIVAFENRFEVPGFRRSDGLVAYFGVNNIVYTLVYYPAGSESVQYRQIMNILMHSFRPDNTVQSIPEQRVLPGITAPAATSSVQEVSTTSEIILEPTVEPLAT